MLVSFFLVSFFSIEILTVNLKIKLIKLLSLCRTGAADVDFVARFPWFSGEIVAYQYVF